MKKKHLTITILLIIALFINISSVNADIVYKTQVIDIDDNKKINRLKFDPATNTHYVVGKTYCYNYYNGNQVSDKMIAGKIIAKEPKDYLAGVTIKKNVDRVYIQLQNRHNTLYIYSTCEHKIYPDDSKLRNRQSTVSKIEVYYKNGTMMTYKFSEDNINNELEHNIGKTSKIKKIKVTYKVHNSKTIHCYTDDLSIVNSLHY